MVKDRRTGREEQGERQDIPLDRSLLCYYYTIAIGSDGVGSGIIEP
jgi:hypothetical protein